MPDRKYKTPNGQIVKESELQAKYGDRFSSLIQDKTFSEVTEPVYKTPNGKYEIESVLKGKYGDKFEELSKNNTFILDLPAQKKNLVVSSTSNGPKLESVQTVGSSGGVNSKMQTLNKTNLGDLSKINSPKSVVPKIDPQLKKLLETNQANLKRKYELESELKIVKVTPENQDEVSAKTDELSKLNKQQETQLAKSEERKLERQNYNKISSLTNKFLTGSSQLGVDMAAIPELAYDIASMPQNFIADNFDLPSLHTDSEKFKKTIGVNNAVKDFYKQEVSKLKEQAQQTDLKYQNGIYDSFVNGDYSAGFDQLTNSFTESLPATSSIMVGGAAMKAPQLIAASSMMFGAGKNEKLKDENPDMNTNIRVANALATGLIQGATESLGTGSIGAAAKGLVEREGPKKAMSILKDGLAEYYKAALTKNPLLASMSGEGLEEAFQGVAENAVDVATGVKPQDYNIYSTMADDFIGGAFGGAVFGAGIKGLKEVTNIQDKNQIKSNTKKVFTLQKELQNPEISEESKAQISKNIDGLIKVNQKLVNQNIDHVESLSPKVKESLLKSIQITESTQDEAKKIKLDPSTSDQTKQILLDSLKKEFNKANELKNNILEGKTTEVDVLPLKEQDKLKREALKELTEELNPDGKKSITITNEQITERANKNYSNQIKDEVKSETTVAETEPQAEVQEQPKAEKVGEEDLRLSLNDSPEIVAEKIKKTKELDVPNLIDSSSNEVKLYNGIFSNSVSTVSDKGKGTKEILPISEDRKIVMMSPGDYLKLVREGFNNNIINNLRKRGADENIIKKYEQKIKEGTDDNINENSKKIIDDAVKKGEKLDMPFIFFDKNGKMIDQDGRNRAVYAKELGEKLIPVLIEDKRNKNETISPTNTSTNGDIQSGTEPMGESGVTEPKNTAKESVPSPVDSGKGKVDVEVKKTTTKEKIAERVKLSDAKIDDWKNAVKDIDSIFGIKIKVDDIEGLNKQGVDIVDVIANIAKQAVAAGIHIDEAIKKTIEHLKKTIDFEVDIEAVKERINPKKEADKADKEAEKETSEKPKETSKELESFRDSWNREPSSDEYNKYDSGRTIEREHGELRNEQNYEIKKDLARVEIGLQAIEHAKKLFKAEYIEKTLEFLQEANLSPEKKAVGFVLLENEMDARVKAQPESIGAKKLQDLVREKSQEFLANSARAIGAGRMRIERYRELAKNGFASEEFTNSLYSSQQLKDKAEIEKLVNISSEDLNKNDDSNITEEIKFDEPKVKRTKEAVKSDLKEALANMRKALNKSALDSMQVGIPYAKQIAVATPHIFKIAKLLAELGEMKTTEIVDFIHDELKEKFPSIGKKEITEILKNETTKTPKSKEEIKNNSIRETVKQALIDAGFYRNVKYKGEIVKRLDWKKIAGEENSVEKLRANVEKSLKEKGLSQKEISKMNKALEEEYNRLSEEIIEKGLKELESRNTPRKPIDMKSAAKKLAELSNYGLFDKNRDSYEYLVNSVLGFNGLDQEAFVEMKQLAKAYVTLMNSGHTEVAMKSALNEINRKQAKLLGKLSFKQSNATFKAIKVLAEITNLSTRFKLVNLGNLAENISSGVVARAINNLTDTFVNKVKGTETTNKKLSSQSRRNARSKLKGIITDASESYGDTSSLLLNNSMLEDYLNEKSRNKLYHTIISAYMGRPVLEGADSYNKILITEAKMNRAVIKILEAKGMSNKEALSHVTEALTGESFETALVKAKDLIEKINTENGSKLLVDTKEAINALASDIVKDALLKGDTMTPKELEASYKAAYKSAGRDIGHVSNNWLSTQIGYMNSSIEKQITEAIKEKDWTKASIYTAYQIFWRNFMSTFVGGGTNWVVKQAQKSANPLSLISLVDDSLHRKGNLDITTDEGIKKMEEQLHREMNYRSTAGTIVFGTLAALTIFGAMKASGGDDDLNEWLKKNKWAKKFFDKMSPDVVVAMLAYKNKDMGRYFAKMLNVKADFFDDQKNILKVLNKYADGKNDEASGQLGGIIGKRFEFLGPLRLINDMQQIYKKETPDYGGVPSGFWNGFFANGILEKNDLRPDPNSEITKGSNKGRSSRSGRRNR